MKFFIAIVLKKFCITCISQEKMKIPEAKEKQRQLEWKTRFNKYFISAAVNSQAITNIYNT